MAGCGLSVDDQTNLYFAVGNGSFNAFNSSGGTEYGDSFIRLSTKAGLQVADYFTPYNQEFLADNNFDVGSGGLLLLPDQPGQLQHLMAGGSKEGQLYLMNRDKMTAANNHFNAKGSADDVLQTVPLGGPVLSTPAYFDGSIYTAASGDVLASFAVSNALLQLDNYQAATRSFPYPGATPSISADGTNNGIVWLVQRSEPAVLLAYDARDLSHELYDSSQADNARGQLPDGVKFAVPTIANGKVYIAGQYGLSVFGLSTNVSPYGAWCALHFGTNANSLSIAGPQADPDRDGLANILEYALGFDPTRPDRTPSCIGVIQSSRFFLQFRRCLLATDVAYEIQKADTASGPWITVATYAPASAWRSGTENATVSESAETGTTLGQYDDVSFSENTGAASPANSFWRVTVSFVR
jgi:hypothetical protein